jgi:hypothetical protein
MKSLSILFFAISLSGFAQTAAPSGPMTNQRVIALVQAGLSAADVARMISIAPKVDFNLTPVFTAQLMQYGVFEDTIKLMAAKERGIEVTSSVNSPAPKSPAAVPAATSAPSEVADFSAKDWMLHEGTPVRLRLMQNLSSATAVEGSSIDFETLDDISVNGTIYCREIQRPSQP